MAQDDSRTSHRLILLVVASILLFASLVIYATRNKPFAITQDMATYHPTIINPEILQNWLPNSSYQYTLARINDYLAANNLAATSIIISNTVATSGDGYAFTIDVSPQQQTMHIGVLVTNFSGTISTAVNINGQPQNPQVSAANPSNTTTITGIDDLVTKGLSVDQANNLRAALQKFAPSAGTITIQTANATHRFDQTTGNVVYTFAVVVDDKSYQAKLASPDLSTIELTLTDGNKQVFDSGLIDSAH